jgi:hypothetical protein
MVEHGRGERTTQLLAWSPARATRRTLTAATAGAVLVARLALIRGPGVDRSQWKEIDFITVARSFQHGAPFWRPSVEWPAVPPRFTAMEFPLVPYVTSFLFRLGGVNALTVRLLPALGAVVLAIYVYRLVARELGAAVGLVAGPVAAILATIHPFGRYLNTETVAVPLTVVALFHLAQWLDGGRRRDAIVGFVALALVVALKLELLFVGLPCVYLVGRARRRQPARARRAVAFGLVALVPAAAWYTWAYHLETTGVHHFSIFKGHDKLQTTTELRSGAWWNTMARAFVHNGMAGVVGLALAVAGAIVVVRLRRGGLFVAWAIGFALFVVIVAEGNLDGPYRQLSAVPLFATAISLGILAVAAGVARWVPVGVTAAVLALTFPLPVAGAVLHKATAVSEPEYPDRWALGRRLLALSEPGDTVVFVGEFDARVGGNDLSPIVSYYSHRQGWILEPGQFTLARVESDRRAGADWFVALPAFSDTPYPAALVQAVRDRYTTAYADGKYVIVDLNSPTP